MIKQAIAGIVITTALISCQQPQEVRTIGTIEKIEPALENILSSDAKIEVLGTGYTWSEGPLWVQDEHMLLFSDVPTDTVYQWTEDKGVQVYLTPSGYTGAGPSNSRERGSNGLALSTTGQLILCQQGNRRIAVMDASLDSPEPKYISLADHYNGKRFDSPNDVITDKKGNLYITDPPYGFKQFEKDPEKEIPFQGVYKVYPNGKVVLLIDSLTKPNGIALSPDQRSLYIANSDPAKARWYRYELSDSGIISGKVFYDVTASTQEEETGLPDGMKVDSKGNVFASGPGGLFIFSSQGKVLGRIRLPNATANCAFRQDEKYLFITSKNNLLRVKLR